MATFRCRYEKHGRPTEALDDGIVRVHLATRLAVLIVSAYFAVDLLVEEVLDEMSLELEMLIEGLLLVPITGVLGWALIVAPSRRVAAEGVGRQHFDQRLHRALEMVESEAECHEVTELALSHLAPGTPVELLLADSSEAHLKQVLPGRGSEAASCGVVAPHACPAIRRAQLQEFSDSGELDACPHLRRSGSATSATCAPVNVVGKSIGVLHIPNPLRDLDVQAIEAAAGQAGTRLGILRVMARAHLQAATDPLTGLLNRRSLEERAQALLQSGIAFAVSFGDLDHFKQLNDVHGHDTGDRALRLFSRTLNGVLRSTDSVARYGGEEFVVLLPGLDCTEAADALRRVQEELLIAIARSGTPGFTVSFGIAHSSQADDFVALLRRADAALLSAKRSGRNRVVLDEGGTADYTPMPVVDG